MVALSLSVKCVPRLMRQGFYLSQENVLVERGFVELNCDESQMGPRDCQAGYKHVRTVVIEDRGAGGRVGAGGEDDREWVGVIRVLAKTQESLATFQMDWLSLENMILGQAMNWNKKWVYKYYQSTPQMNFNAIYDDMPL